MQVQPRTLLWWELLSRKAKKMARTRPTARYSYNWGRRPGGRGREGQRPREGEEEPTKQFQMFIHPLICMDTL